MEYDYAYDDTARGAKEQPLPRIRERGEHYGAPLTAGEESMLLGRAVEYGRIRSIGRTMPSLPSARAREAGYGLDIDGYERALDLGQKARDALVTRNMGLVHFVVSEVLGEKIRRRGRGGLTGREGRRRLNSLSREDLIQEGAIGLSRAVRGYNPDASVNRGARFGTYAVYWIRASVLRCIAERDDLVRVPEHVTGAVRRAAAAASRLGLEVDGDGLVRDVMGGRGRAAAWREAEAAKALAVEAGLTDGQLGVAMRVDRRRRGGGYTSFEPWMQGSIMKGGGGGGGGGVSTSGAVGVGGTGQISAQTAEGKEELRLALSPFLKPRELEALSWRYGLLHQRGGRKGEGIETTTVELRRGGAPGRREFRYYRAEAAEGLRAAGRRRFRDYEAEAMEGLFGDRGILGTEGRRDDDCGGAESASAPTRTRTRTLGPKPVGRRLRPIPPPQRGRWGEAMSFAEVGGQMAVSAEYGRRLCRRALVKLRTAAEDGRLQMEPDWLV